MIWAALVFRSAALGDDGEGGAGSIKEAKQMGIQAPNFHKSNSLLPVMHLGVVGTAYIYI